ncbi:hypothetical protein [Micromonospora sp. L32]|uniref:hypothetical protein n=1 Tax=Micromonospora sp. L32 TaxID=3452214 RepID=UPI003F8CB8A0
MFEDHVELHGSGIIISEGLRLTLPVTVADHVLALLQQAEQHQLVKNWQAWGGRFLIKHRGSAIRETRERLAIDPSGRLCVSTGTAVNSVVIPHQYLRFFISALDRWIDLANTEEAAPTRPVLFPHRTKKVRQRSDRPTFAFPVNSAHEDWHVDLFEDHLILRGAGMMTVPPRGMVCRADQAAALCIMLEQASRHPVAQVWYKFDTSIESRGIWGRMLDRQRLHLHLVRPTEDRSCQDRESFRVHYSMLRSLIRCVRAGNRERELSRTEAAPRELTCRRRNCQETELDPVTYLCRSHHSSSGNWVNVVSGGGVEQNRRRH